MKHDGHSRLFLYEDFSGSTKINFEDGIKLMTNKTSDTNLNDEMIVGIELSRFQNHG